jgi:acetolactate synthase-1/2/3 large subunit
MVEYHPKLWNQDNAAKIIHIDFEPAEIDEYYIPEVEIVGDIAHALWRLNGYINYHGIEKFDDKYYEKIRKNNMSDINEHGSDKSSGLIKPQKFLYDLRKSLEKNDILISDVGAHKMWIARNFNCYEPNTCIIPNGFCSMGFALPASIAADLLNTGNKIYAIAGDGGFLMNLQEMETAKRLGVNIVVIIWEDRSYGLIKWKQQVQFGENTDLDFTNPDWKLLAKSFGWNYIFEDESSQLILTLKKIKKLKGPTLLIIPIDYSENLKLTQKLNDLEVE